MLWTKLSTARGVAILLLALLALASCGLPGSGKPTPTPTPRPMVVSSAALSEPGPTVTPVVEARPLPTPQPTNTATPVPVTIHITDSGFAPSTVTIPRGGFVIWINDGPSHHTVTEDHNRFDSGTLDAGRVFTLTFIHRGSFSYHCGWFPGLHGSVVVR